MRLCLIPARGGSKRIPRKNIKPFFGKPMIVWSIEAALACNEIDRVIVSTDDDEIAEVAKKAGADVPFRRSAELSNDYATTMDVIRDALTWADREIDEPVTELCCLYATAPFATAADLSAALETMLSAQASCAFSATEYAFPIQRAVKVENGRVAMFQPENANTRSQDLDPAFHDAGQFYWLTSDAIRANLPIFGPSSVLHLMDRMRVQDIDTPEDWVFAERLFEFYCANGRSSE